MKHGSSGARIELERLLQRPDAEIPLAEAALRIAEEEYPDIDVHGYLERLADMGRTLAGSLAHYSGTEGSAPDGGWTRADRIRALRNYLYGDQGFRGAPDPAAYHDPRNSCLNEVLDRRMGLPITLSLVFIEVGRAIGLELAGVGFPGHFLVKTVDNGPELLLDPYNKGGEVSLVEAMDRLERISGGRKLPPEEFTDAITSRQFLYRILANLKACYVREERHDETLAVIDRLLLIHPRAHAERRDRGLLLLRQGDYHRAHADLESYLAAVPHADDRERIERRIEQARALGFRMN